MPPPPHTHQKKVIKFVFMAVMLVKTYLFCWLGESECGVEG